MSASLIVWFALSIGCDVVGNVLFKTGADQLAHGAPLARQIRAALTNPWIASGIGVYVVEIFVWLKILSVAPLSIAFPIASLNFLGVTIASATILREKVGRAQWAGALLVTVGVAIVAGTA